MSEADPQWVLAQWLRIRTLAEERVPYRALFHLQQHDTLYLVELKGQLTPASPAFTRFEEINRRLSNHGANLSLTRGLTKQDDPNGRPYDYAGGPIAQLGFRAAEMTGDPLLGDEVTSITIAEAKEWDSMPTRASGDEFCGMSPAILDGYFRSIEFAHHLRRHELAMAELPEEPGHDLHHGDGYVLFGPTLWKLLIKQAEQSYPLLTNLDFIAFIDITGNREEPSPALRTIKAIADVADSLSSFLRSESRLFRRTDAANYVHEALARHGFVEKTDVKTSAQIVKEARERYLWLEATTPRFQLAPDHAEKIIEASHAFLNTPNQEGDCKFTTQTQAFADIVGTDLSEVFVVTPAIRPDHPRPPQLTDLAPMTIGL